MSVVLFVGCAPKATLSPADNEANDHFVRALALNNEVTAWLNSLGGPEPKVGSMDIASLRANIDQLNKAANEANAVSPDFLQRVHPQLADMWRTTFIPGVEGERDYYAATLANPLTPPAPSKIVEAVALSERFGAWYESNQQTIRDGIRRQASG
jgi:hypothetical protein